MKKYKAIAIPVTFEDDRPRFLTVRDRRFKDWIFVTGGCRRREIYNPLRCALRELEEEILSLEAESAVARGRAARIAERVKQEGLTSKLLASRYYQSASALPRRGVGIITLVGLFSDADTGDARAIRRALLSRSKGCHSTTEPVSTLDASSDLLRKLLAIYVPTRSHKKGAKTLPALAVANLRYRPTVAFDRGPLPCSDVERPPRICFATRYHSIYVHVILEMSPKSVRITDTLSLWHSLYVKFQMNRAADVIANSWRGVLSRRELQSRAAAARSAAETAASILVQTRFRVILARKRVTLRKRQISEEKLRAKQEAERYAQRKKRELQQAKKRAAAAAMKKRRDEILAREAAEKKRRGW